MLNSVTQIDLWGWLCFGIPEAEVIPHSLASSGQSRMIWRKGVPCQVTCPQHVYQVTAWRSRQLPLLTSPACSPSISKGIFQSNRKGRQTRLHPILKESTWCSHNPISFPFPSSPGKYSLMCTKSSLQNIILRKR